MHLLVIYASKLQQGRRPACLLAIVVALVALAVGGGRAVAASTMNLGTASSFAVLAGSTITNTGPSTITGDVGLSPGSAVTGFAPCTPPAPANCVTRTGALQIANGVALQAKNDQLTAYNNLVGRQSTCTRLNVELSGQTLTPGTYCSPGTFNLAAGGTLTLDANGDPDAEFIFLTGAGGSTLITGADSQVLVIDGAQACHVYWQVASSAVIGVGTDFVGHILAAQSISLLTRATVQGSAFASNGAVTLDTNTITNAACAADTSTAVSSSPNPAGLGVPVALTATVTSTNGVTPMGGVTFLHNGTPIATAPVGSNGTATTTISSLGSGTHTITARYHGGPGFETSRARGVTQLVTQVATTTTSRPTSSSASFRSSTKALGGIAGSTTTTRLGTGGRTEGSGDPRTALPHTGSNLTEVTATGLLAVVLGGLLIELSQRHRRSRPGPRGSHG